MQPENLTTLAYGETLASRALGYRGALGGAVRKVEQVTV